MFSLFFISFVIFPAQADLKSNLQAFHENPKSYYMQHLTKYDRNGQPQSSSRSGFLTQENELLSRKLQVRKAFLKSHSHTDPNVTIAPGANDNANTLFNTPLIDNIFELKNLGIDQAHVDKSPWAGDYWAYYRGILGNRFQDEEFRLSADWESAYNYILKNPFFAIFSSGQPDKINTLSVSEKYDLIVGDQDGTLTTNMWQQGAAYQDHTGAIETWMGICEGWAAAAIMSPRPTKSIETVAYDGKTKIMLNPSELKGLVSYLWARTPYPARFVGGRCNFKDVKRDDLGRPTSIECLDTNPATWHVSVLNRVGISKRSFIMDATADYEVWNQPIYGYSLKYFNPQTLESSLELQNNIIASGEFTNDKFKEYRSDLATQMIGIEMTLQYVTEESSNTRPTNAPEDDALRTVTYIYDLELDANGKIVGGEWYQNEHPDFLWTPNDNAFPFTAEDARLNAQDWNGDTVLPESWREAAMRSSKTNLILSVITNKLIERAQ